jgi:hypothetical protein
MQPALQHPSVLAVFVQDNGGAEADRVREGTEPVSQPASQSAIHPSIQPVSQSTSHLSIQPVSQLVSFVRVDINLRL